MHLRVALGSVRDRSPPSLALPFALHHPSFRDRRSWRGRSRPCPLGVCMPEGWFAREDGFFYCTLSRSWSLAVRDGFAGVLATVLQWFRCCSEPLTLSESPCRSDKRCGLAGPHEVASLSYPIHTVHHYSPNCDLPPCLSQPLSRRCDRETLKPSWNARESNPSKLWAGAASAVGRLGFPHGPSATHDGRGQSGCF